MIFKTRNRLTKICLRGSVRYCREMPELSVNELMPGLEAVRVLG